MDEQRIAPLVVFAFETVTTVKTSVCAERRQDYPLGSVRQCPNVCNQPVLTIQLKSNRKSLRFIFFISFLYRKAKQKQNANQQQQHHQQQQSTTQAIQHLLYGVCTWHHNNHVSVTFKHSICSEHSNSSKRLLCLQKNA